MPTTYRLASKIEEIPNTGSGNWDRVTVFLPNSSYVLSKVELQNNKLSIVFDFSDASTYLPVPFAFLLSGFGIDASQIDSNTKHLVIGIQNPNDDADRTNAIGSFGSWFSNQNYYNNYISKLQRKEQSDNSADHRCPPFCLN